jgi:hypothetical protein
MDNAAFFLHAGLPTPAVTAPFSRRTDAFLRGTHARDHRASDDRVPAWAAFRRTTANAEHFPARNSTRGLWFKRGDRCKRIEQLLSAMLDSLSNPLNAGFLFFPSTARETP